MFKKFRIWEHRENLLAFVQAIACGFNHEDPRDECQGYSSTDTGKFNDHEQNGINKEKLYTGNAL